MVFLGKDFRDLWANEVPLRRWSGNSRGRPNERLLLVIDDIGETVDLLDDYAAQPI